MEQKKQSIFKKWWVWLIIVVVVFAVIGSTTNKDNGQPAAAKPLSDTKETPKPTPTPAPVLTKEGVSSDVKIVIEGLETSQTIGDNQFATAKAQGTFKIVKITLTNNQKDAITIDSNNFKLIDDQSREYGHSTESLLALQSSKVKKESFFLTKLNPGLSATGYIAYDVPKDAKGFILEATGGMTGKKIKLKVE
ncbi:DUF4352 domain-containing protein [Paenibacillus sp. KN14-4R]|uniref:DUF4352 domain-containing protein n=1 Tax=Paenibacillus sp. KN14-4R TaxID=3445773 RepID=UPI003F9EDF86